MPVNSEISFIVNISVGFPFNKLFIICISFFTLFDALDISCRFNNLMARSIIRTGLELRILEGVFQRYIGNIISTDMVCNSKHALVQQIEFVFNNQFKIFIKVIHSC